MLTYIQIKNIINNCYDFDDVVLELLSLLLLIPLDLITIFLQPLFFIIYRLWRREWRVK